MLVGLYFNHNLKKERLWALRRSLGYHPDSSRNGTTIVLISGREYCARHLCHVRCLARGPCSIHVTFAFVMPGAPQAPAGMNEGAHVGGVGSSYCSQGDGVCSCCWSVPFWAMSPPQSQGGQIPWSQFDSLWPWSQLSFFLAEAPSSPGFRDTAQCPCLSMSLSSLWVSLLFLTC